MAARPAEASRSRPESLSRPPSVAEHGTRLRRVDSAFHLVSQQTPSAADGSSRGIGLLDAPRRRRPRGGFHAESSALRTIVPLSVPSRNSSGTRMSGRRKSTRTSSGRMDSPSKALSIVIGRRRSKSVKRTDDDALPGRNVQGVRPIEVSPETRLSVHRGYRKLAVEITESHGGESVSVRRMQAGWISVVAAVGILDPQLFSSRIPAP